MNHRKRMIRRRAGSLETLTHEQLTERAIALGCPAFCGSWETATLIRKIQEIENA